MTGTIFAPATPMGRSGVAVIRVSGEDAFKSLYAFTGKKFTPRMATLANLRAGLEIIDRALILTFKNPASFTGEDIVEYHVHGGRAVVDSLLNALASQKNHRMAEAGEFTRRAFDNGKIDLTEAEGLADLINAETQLQKAQALAQMEGSLSRLYASWTGDLKIMLAHLEADIEFPDEDLPAGILPSLMPDIERLIEEITEHLADNRRGERLRDGIQIAVIGAPNAGKSSLVNALAQRDISIVSELAGTTRDVIEAHLDLGGYPVIIADTAGLRPENLSGGGHAGIENEGMRRALIRARDADIKILLFDAGEKFDAATWALADENSILLFNKIDRHPREGGGPNARCKANRRFVCSPLKANNPLGVASRGHNIVRVSAKTGAGLEEFTAALLIKIKILVGASEAPAVTRARYREHLNECLASLRRS
ncbi:MAG: tRNA uridine-5-carboxymethylaminomethyl(34) synthesis GTPase MnmE, partial [Alphaproteobacteria bacterium]